VSWTKLAGRGAAAGVVWVAASMFGILPARADACSDTWFYGAMASTGERDLREYSSEGGTQLARSDFELVNHNMDMAAQTVNGCKQPDTLAKYAFADAERWQIGYDQGWVPARISARHVHDALARLHAIRFDRRDPVEFNAVQIRDKAMFKAAGLPWPPIH